MLSADKAVAEFVQKRNELDADKVLAGFINQQKELGAKPMPREFLARLKAQLPTLIQQLSSVYTDYPAFELFIQKLIAVSYSSYSERPSALKSTRSETCKKSNLVSISKNGGRRLLCRPVCRKSCWH